MVFSGGLDVEGSGATALEIKLRQFGCLVLQNTLDTHPTIPTSYRSGAKPLPVGRVHLLPWVPYTVCLVGFTGGLGVSDCGGLSSRVVVFLLASLSPLCRPSGVPWVGRGAAPVSRFVCGCVVTSPRPRGRAGGLFHSPV